MRQGVLQWREEDQRHGHQEQEQQQRGLTRPGTVTGPLPTPGAQDRDATDREDQPRDGDQLQLAIRREPAAEDEQRDIGSPQGLVAAPQGQQHEDRDREGQIRREVHMSGGDMDLDQRDRDQGD